MFHVYWPGVGILTLLVVLVIMIILMYGDSICARVKTQKDVIMARRYQERQYRDPQQYSEEPNLELQRSSKHSYAHEIEV